MTTPKHPLNNFERSKIILKKFGYTLHEAARICGVSVADITRAALRGRIKITGEPQETRFVSPAELAQFEMYLMTRSDADRWNDVRPYEPSEVKSTFTPCDERLADEAKAEARRASRIAANQAERDATDAVEAAKIAKIAIAVATALKAHEAAPKAVELEPTN